MNQTMDPATVSNDEVRRTLEQVATTTQNPRVRSIMTKALHLLDADSLAPAASTLLSEMAKTKRLERTILWLGPVAALAATAVLFAALRGLGL